MSHGGDSWRPTPERYSGVPKKPSVVKENTEWAKKHGKSGGGFWRRDQPEEDGGSSISRDSRHETDHSNHPNPPIQPNAMVSTPRERSRSFSNTMALQKNAEVPIRPVLQTRHTSHSPLQFVTSPTHLGPSANDSSKPGDQQRSPLPTTATSKNDAAAMVTRDPRLKVRVLTRTISQADSTASEGTANRATSANEWEILKSLSVVEAQRLSLENESNALDKQFAALKSEFQAYQFKNHTAYSQQIAGKMKSLETKQTLMSSKMAANDEKSQELLDSFAEARQTRDGALTARLTALYQAETNRIRQEQNDMVTQQKSLLAQFESHIKAFDEISRQVRDQAALIGLLQQQNEELKEMATTGKSQTPESPSEKERRSAELQNLLDPVQAQIKEQKLTIAKLNEIFTPLSSFQELEARLKVIDKPAEATVGSTAAYITREDFQPYIENFNKYSKAVEGDLNNLKSGLNRLESKDKASPIQEDRPTNQELEKVRLKLESESKAQFALGQRLAALEIEVKEKVLDHDAYEANVRDIRSTADTATINIGKIVQKINNLELKSQRQSSGVLNLDALATEDKEKFRQALSLRNDFNELQKKTNHSIKSLSERWNNLRTDDLARRILATLNPTINNITPHINQLRQQYQELKPIKGELALHTESTNEQIAQLDTRISSLLGESTKIQGEFEELQASNSSTSARLEKLEADTTSIKKDIGQAQADISSNCSANESTRKDLEGAERGFQSSIETLQKDFRLDQSNLAEQFREARDSLIARVDELEAGEKLMSIDPSAQQQFQTTVADDDQNPAAISSPVSSSKKSNKPKTKRDPLRNVTSNADPTPGSSEPDPASSPNASQAKRSQKSIDVIGKCNDRKSMRDIWGPAAKLGKSSSQSEGSPRSLRGSPARYSTKSRFEVVEIEDSDKDDDGGVNNNDQDNGNADDVSTTSATRTGFIDIMDPRNWQKEALTRLQSSNGSTRENSHIADDAQTSSTIEVAVEKPKRKRDRSREDSGGRKHGEHKLNSSQPEGRHRKKKKKTQI